MFFRLVDVWVEISEKIRKLHFLSQATLANVRRLNLLFRNGYFWFFSHAIPFPQRKFFSKQTSEGGPSGAKRDENRFQKSSATSIFCGKSAVTLDIFRFFA